MAKRRPQPAAAVPAAFLLRLPQTAAIVLILAWLGLLAWGYREHLVLQPQVAGYLLNFLSLAFGEVAVLLCSRLPWLAAIWLASLSIGALWSRTLRLSGSRLEGLLFAAALGFGSLSLILLGFGAVRLYSPGALKPFLLVLAGGSLIGAKWWWAWLPKEALPRQKVGPWEAAALLVLLAAVALEVCGALTPEIFYDSLVYHLALPKLYLIKGRLAAVPSNIFSGTPQGVQLLYGLCLAVCDEKLASLLHLSLGLAATAAVYSIGRRLRSRAAGILAGLAFFVCPMTLYAGWGCGVDLGASFYCVAAFALMLRDLPLAAGLLLGFACGTKYNVLPLAAVLAGVYLWQLRSLGRPGRSAGLLLAGAAAAFCPWLVKNAALLGNPLYPYLRGLFGDHGWIADWQGFVSDVGRRSLAETLFSADGLKALLLQPWTTSVGAWSMGDWPGPLFLALIPWLLLLRPNARPPRALLFAGALGYLAWTLATKWVRYMLPLFPLLALCAALAVESGAWPRWLRRAGWLVALYGALFNLQVAFHHGAGMGQWQCLAGAVSREDYLKTQRVTYPLPYYSAAQFINRSLPPQAKVLLLGESRTYYIERECLAATVFDRNPFWLAAQEASDGEDLLRRVRAMGITHVLLSAQELILRRDSAAVFPRDTARRPALAQFWARHLKPLFEDRQDGGGNPRWLTVYEVVDQPNPPGQETPNPVSAVLAALP